MLSDAATEIRPTAFSHIVRVRVPKDTKWDALAAQQCMVGLFSIADPLELRIRGTVDDIAWEVETPAYLASTVDHTFYGVYPRSQVERFPKTRADIDHFVYELNGAAPFHGPIQHAVDFKADPLNGLLAPLNQLRTGEEVILSLRLTTPSTDYHGIGRRQLTRSGFRWFHFLTPRMASEVLLFRAFFDVNRVRRLPSDLHRLSEGKLRMPLKEVSLALRIKAENNHRTHRIAALFDPAFTLFGRNGLNYLVPVQSGSYKLVLSPPEVAALWHLPSTDCLNGRIRWATDFTGPLPRELARNQKGVMLGKHHYRGNQTPVFLPHADRETHISVVGRTRTGKSTLLHNLIHQDIAAGHGVGVIDPHGELVENILCTSIPPEREDDVVLFDLQESEKIIGLNLMATPKGVQREKAASMTLNILKKFFAEEWRSGRMEDTLYAALVSLMSIDGSVVLDIARILADPVFRAEVIRQVDDIIALDYWMLEFNAASEAQQQVLAQPIRTRIRKLYRDPTLRRIVGQPDSLDFEDIMANRKILLVNLRGSASAEVGVGDTLGALLITKLHMAAMGRAKHDGNQQPPFHLYVDEVQNFTTSSLPLVLSQAGKFGLFLCIANQYLHQLSGDILKSVLGNIGTSMLFRAGPEEADLLKAQLRPNFTRESVENLSRFRMITKMQYRGITQPAFLVHASPPIPKPENGLESAERIREKSRAKHGVPAKEIDEMLRQRYRPKPGEQPVADLTEEMDFFG